MQCMNDKSTHVSYFQRPQDRLTMRLTKKIRDVRNYYRNYITKIKDGPLEKVKAAKGMRSKNKYSRQHNSRASNRDEKSCIKLAT